MAQSHRGAHLRHHFAPTPPYHDAIFIYIILSRLAAEMMGSWQVASGLGRSCRSVFHRVRHDIPMLIIGTICLHM